jgi:hypothetical protein
MIDTIKIRMKYYIDLLKNSGECVVYNKEIAEQLAKQYDAKILNAAHNGYLVTTNIK